MNVWINKFTGDVLHRKLNSLTVITIFECHYFSWIADFQICKMFNISLIRIANISKISFFLNSFQSFIYKELLTHLQVHRKWIKNNYNNRFIAVSPSVRDAWLFWRVTQYIASIKWNMTDAVYWETEKRLSRLWIVLRNIRLPRVCPAVNTPPAQ